MEMCFCHRVVFVFHLECSAGEEDYAARHVVNVYEVQCKRSAWNVEDWHVQSGAIYTMGRLVTGRPLVVHLD